MEKVVSKENGLVIDSTPQTRETLKLKGGKYSEIKVFNGSQNKTSTRKTSTKKQVEKQPETDVEKL